MMIDDIDKLRKGLVSLSIEKSLLDMGQPVYDEVVEFLEEEYNCYLPDCYEHPEYLSEAIKKLYGNAHLQIIKSINEELKEFSYTKPVERFLEVISK
jgi:hypothetical protein